MSSTIDRPLSALSLSSLSSSSLDSPADLGTPSDAVTTPEPTENLKFDLNAGTIRRYERMMGDTETAYYLPSRENGVNDMWLHLGFKAKPALMERPRVALVWSILRLRHPLMASKIEMHDYEDIRFVYHSHASPAEALADSERSFDYTNEMTWTDSIDSFLNGSRILSDQKLTQLVICTPRTIDEESELQDYHFLLYSVHFIGDGMGLHAFANDFFELLGGSKTTSELEDLLHAEWDLRLNNLDQASLLPDSMEERLPQRNDGKFYRTATRVDFDNYQNKMVGGHVFPRFSGRPRQTVVPRIAIDEDRTKRMLKTCKSRGVTISSAILAICNIAWARTSPGKSDLPLMMYTAANIRPSLIPPPEKPLPDSYFYLAITYFNIILPSFLPSEMDVEKVFWHRAKVAKAQCSQFVKHPMLIPRCREMARDRAVRAKIFGREDDALAAGLPRPAPPKAQPSVAPARPKAPSSALLGLSLLGALDNIYKHANYPDIRCHTLTSACRQRPGAMLLFIFTFINKLWISLPHDQNGLDKVVVDTFWGHLVHCLDEFLDKDL